MTTEKKSSSKIGGLWMKLPQPIRYGILSLSAAVIQITSFTLLYVLMLRSNKTYWWACYLPSQVLIALYGRYNRR
jgi:hypothetical protein